MKEKFNCPDDYNESLKVEIIARVDSYYANLAGYREDIFYWKILLFRDGFDNTKLLVYVRVMVCHVTRPCRTAFLSIQY